MLRKYYENNVILEVRTTRSFLLFLFFFKKKELFVTKLEFLKNGRQFV
jgi:hypothetical protein